MTEAEDPWYGWNPTEYDADRRNDPYPLINRLREEHPVHVTPHGYWRILRHADVIRVLKELPVGVRTTDGVLLGIGEEDGPRNFMLLQDPPNHTRLRRLVSHAFTPPAIERMRDDVQRLVDELLDRAEEQRQWDVIAGLARPVPSTVICKMLGVPLEDRERFTDWTALATHLLSPRTLSAELRPRAIEGALHLVGYMADLIADRRSHLGDDMLSVLIRAEESGDRLSEQELMSQSVGLLIAGFETTIGLIGNGVRQLLLHPDQFTRLREHPDLVDRAVEECLRFDGPISATRRVLHADAEIGGQHIAKNTEVFLSLASAHRDPRVYDDPDRFDIGREHHSHLAFGGGIHFCLGAHLARMETQIAVGSLVRRFGSIRLTDDETHWGKSLFRVLGKLPVEVRT